MSGRIENDMLIDKSVINKIKDGPSILMEYFDYLSEGNGSVTATSRRVLINQAKRFLTWVKDNKDIDIMDTDSFGEIKEKAIKEFIVCAGKPKYDKNGNVHKVKDETKRDLFSSIKNFYHFLLKEGYIKEDPCNNIDPVKVRKREKPITYLTADEISKVKEKITNISNCPERDAAIFAIGVRTGLRVTAICNIDIDDIDFENLVIKNIIEKGEIEKEIYISQNTADIIKKWIVKRGNVKTNALFTNIDGYKDGKNERIKYYAVRRILKDSTKDLGKNITPHKMRSTCATNLYELTGDIYRVADQLGHSNLDNTRRYTSVIDNKKRENAELLDLL